MALEPYALSDVESFREWIGEEDAPEGACEQAINGVSDSLRRYLDRQLMPVQNNVEKTFWYDGSGFLDLSGTELRFGDTTPTITLYADLPASQQVVLAGATVSSEADYGWEAQTHEGTMLQLVLARADAMTYSTSDYSRNAIDKGVSVKIAADWGAGVIPALARLACNIAAAEMYRNPEAGDARSLGPLQIDADEDDDWAFGLPRRVRRMVSPLRRSTFV